jgi:hypothetical protein
MFANRRWAKYCIEGQRRHYALKDHAHQLGSKRWR